MLKRPITYHDIKYLRYNERHCICVYVKAMHYFGYYRCIMGNNTLVQCIEELDER